MGGGAFRRAGAERAVAAVILWLERWLDDVLKAEDLSREGGCVDGERRRVSHAGLTGIAVCGATAVCGRAWSS